MSVIGGGLANSSIAFNETPSSGYLAATPVQIPPCRVQALFKTGVLADQVDGLAVLPINLAASTPQTISLNSLVDLFGAAIAVTRLRLIAFKVLSQTDGAVLKVGNAGSNEFDGFLSAGGTMTVFPSSPLNDGFTVISAPNVTGMPVTGSTGNLKLDPGANAMQVIVIIATCSS